MGKLRLSALRAVFKKEMIDILRDKRTLAVMILLPLVLYPAILLIGSQVGIRIAQRQDAKVFPVAFDFVPDDNLIHLMEEASAEYQLELIEVNNLQNALENADIMTFVNQTQENGMLQYSIHYRSSSSDSELAGQRMRSLLEDYKSVLSREQIKQFGLDPDIILEPLSFTLMDESREEETAGRFLGMILPLILILGLVTGAMYPAIDVTAGEKERGTLETLLTLPLSNLELMGGKFMAVSLIAILSGFLNFLSLILVGFFLITSLNAQIGADMTPITISLTSLVPAFLVTLVCIIVFALFVSALILCITSYAKSFKEAQNYMTPIILLFMFPAYLPMIPDIQLTMITATIPVVNISLLIRDVLLLTYNPGHMAMVLASNIVYALLAILFLSKIYQSEGILFGDGAAFSLFERRSNIPTGSKVSLADGLVIYLIGILLLLYAGTYLQLKLGFWGIAATQGIILALPVMAAIYLKTNLKETFSLHMPRFSQFLGALLLWGGTFILVNLISQVLLYFFPQNDAILIELTDIMTGQSLAITLLVIAVLPAICEEAFFRGFLFSALRENSRPVTAIVATGLLFGLYHIAPIRIVPTALLGIAFSLALFKSGSLLIPVLMHMVNNGAAVVITKFPEPSKYLITLGGTIENIWTLVPLSLLLSAVLLVEGSRLLERKESKYKKQEK